MKGWSRWTDTAHWKKELRQDSQEAMDAVRFHTRRGGPFGSDAFIARMEALLGHRLRPLAVGRPKKVREK